MDDKERGQPGWLPSFIFYRVLLVSRGAKRTEQPERFSSSVRSQIRTRRKYL